MSDEIAPEAPPSDSPKPGGGGAEIAGASTEDLPPRADRDRFGSLAKNVANPDRSCLTCAVLVLGAILLLIACLVYYYYANAAFHQP